MLSKCVNPACSAQFRYLHDGKVFRVDLEERVAGRTPLRASSRAGVPVNVAGPQLLTSGKRPEYFWLCGECSRQMTLGADGGSVILLKLPHAETARHAAAS
jgi:hypothetical protein